MISVNHAFRMCFTESTYCFWEFGLRRIHIPRVKRHDELFYRCAQRRAQPRVSLIAPLVLSCSFLSRQVFLCHMEFTSFRG